MHLLNSMNSESGIELYPFNRTLLESLSAYSVANNLEPSLEVYMTNEIPNLRIFKPMTMLPFAKSNAQKGSIVFLNTKTLNDSIKIMNHPKLVNKNHYHRYYIDYKYHIRVLNKTYIENNRKARINTYTTVQKAVTGVTGLNELEQAHEKNLFFDMHKYNNFFLEREASFGNYKLKVQEFIRILKLCIEDPRLKAYTNRLMVIDIKSWLPGETNHGLVKRQYNNIVYVFYYLMKHDFNTFKSIGNIDIVFLGENAMFRMNPSKFIEKEIETYRKLVNLISPKEIISDKDEESEELINKLGKINNRYAFTGKVDGETEEPTETTPGDEKEKKSILDILDKILNMFPLEKRPKNRIDLLVMRDELVKDVAKFADRYAFTGSVKDGEVDKDQEEVQKKIEDKASAMVDKVLATEPERILNKKELADELSDELLNDEDFQREIKLMKAKSGAGRSTASLKRDEMLKKRQAELVVKDTTVGNELEFVSPDEVKLEVHDVTEKVDTTNPNMTKISFPDFEKEYNEKLYTEDILNCVRTLNNKDIKIYIRDIKVEDTSNEMNLKETWTINLEDEHRTRHTLKFDVPIFYQDKYLILGGNKKIINKQQVMKPVIKSTPDSVRLCSNYSKIFVYRYGHKSTPDLEALRKVLEGYKTTSTLILKKGNVSKTNANYLTTFDYDELSKYYREIGYKSSEREFHFLFDQNELQEKMKALHITKKDIPENSLCVGYIKDKKINKFYPITVDYNTETISNTGYSIPSYIASLIGGEILEKFAQKKPGKKHIYSRAKIMKKFVPTVFLLSYFEGLSTVMRKAGIKYHFSDQKPKERVYMNQSIIKFADGYLIYENMPFSKQLLMNGLAECHTEDYNFTDFDDKDVYIDLMEMLYGRRNIASAFMQFYEFFIDPKTEQILEMLGYPTKFTELMLYANDLLADNQFTTEIDMNCCRIRSNEIVMSFVYKGIADAYLRYKNTVHNNNPVKMSVPQDFVLKELVTNQIVEDYSKLNPIVELEKSRVCTAKGPDGVNLSDAFTEEKRSYHDSMVGIFGISTSPKNLPLGHSTVMCYKKIL